MIYGIYSIRDAAAGVYTAPTIDISDAAAIRNFQQACSNAGSVMNFKPADFSLCRVGEFDVETGEVTPVPLKILLVGDGYVKGVDADV